MTGLDLDNIIGGYSTTSHDMVSVKIFICPEKILKSKKANEILCNFNSGNLGITESQLVSLLIAKAKIRLILLLNGNKQIQDECLKFKTRTKSTTKSLLKNPPDFFLKPVIKQSDSMIGCEFKDLYFWEPTKGKPDYQFQFDLLLYRDDDGDDEDGASSPIVLASISTNFFAVKSKRLAQKEIHQAKLLG